MNLYKSYIDGQSLYYRYIDKQKEEKKQRKKSQSGLEDTTKKMKIFLNKLKRGNPKVAINYNGTIKQK